MTATMIDSERKRGRCPWSGTECKHAKRCELDKIGACQVAVQNGRHSCQHCKLKMKTCAWTCWKGGTRRREDAE